MNFIKGIISYFYPRNFEGDTYAWITNQTSHTALGLGLIYLLNLFIGLLTTINPFILPVVFMGLWFIWEARHLKITKDVNDFFEDLFFEWSGVLIFVSRWWLIPWSIVTVYLYIKKRKEWLL